MFLGKVKSLIKIATALSVAALIGGCANKEFGHIKNGIDEFSYVQWDNEHAVTVRHIKPLDSYVYISGKYDLQFFKHKSDKVPVWGNYISNEEVKMSGFVNGSLKDIKGYDMGTTVKVDSYPVPSYRATNADLEFGMAGGPTFNTNGEVIGINIGKSKELVKYGDDYYKVSIYLPYEIIQSEWKNYQEIINKQ